MQWQVACASTLCHHHLCQPEDSHFPWISSWAWPSKLSSPFLHELLQAGPCKVPGLRVYHWPSESEDAASTPSRIMSEVHEFKVRKDAELTSVAERNQTMKSESWFRTDLKTLK